MYSTKIPYSLTVLLSSVLFTSQVSAVDFRTVVLNRDIAPGTDGRTFFQFGPARINQAGQIAFRADLCCPGLPPGDRQGIWSEEDESLALVIRLNVSPPVPGAEFFSGWNSIQLNESGQFAFVGQYSIPNDLPFNGIWSNTSGVLSPIARSSGRFLGTPEAHAPGTPSGVEFFSFGASGPPSPVVLNDGGTVAFRGTLIGNGVDNTNDHGIWIAHEGNVSLLARTGNSAPGAPNGVVFRNIAEPILNDANQVALLSYLGGTGVDNTNDIGILMDDGSGLRLIARTGDLVNASQSESVFADLFFPTINHSGQMAFRGSVSGPGTDSTNDGRIWLMSNGAPETVAYEGAPAPGTPDGVTFQGTFHQPQLNDVGQIAFTTGIAGPGVDTTSGGGIWLYDHGELKLVARNNTQAPGLADGIELYSVIAGSLNNVGQIVFSAGLDGPGVTHDNNSSLWIKDGDAAPRLILREGDVLNVSRNPLIEDLRVVGDGFGGGGLNDSGQLALRIQFTDFTFGLFVFDVSTVPEPSSASLLALAIMSCATSRVRRSDQ